MPSRPRLPDPSVNDVVDANRKISRPEELEGDARMEDALDRGLSGTRGTPAAPPLDSEADRSRPERRNRRG